MISNPWPGRINFRPSGNYIFTYKIKYHTRSSIKIVVLLICSTATIQPLVSYRRFQVVHVHVPRISALFVFIRTVSRR